MELKIEDGVSEIAKAQYVGNVEIESVFIPASVVKIGAKAFMGCINLHDVTIEEGAKSLEIGESAFEGCKALRAIDLPGRTNRFLDACFKDSGLESLVVGHNGDYIAKGFYLFAGCPAATLLGETLEEERLSRVDARYCHQKREHAFHTCDLTLKLQACKSEVDIATALQSIYARMEKDGDFDVQGYSDKYKAACAEFASVSDWMGAGGELVKSLVAGKYARCVASINRGEVWDWEWNDDNLSEIREICVSVRRADFDEDALRERFYRAFTRIRHHTAFHRLMAMAHPNDLVQIPDIATLVPLYSWLAKQNPPTVEQAKWYELSNAVRVALSKMLPNVDVYNAGVFAWYLANAFRDNPKGDDVKRKDKTLGWMREFGLINDGTQNIVCAN